MGYGRGQVWWSEISPLISFGRNDGIVRNEEVGGMEVVKWRFCAKIAVFQLGIGGFNDLAIG